MYAIKVNDLSKSYLIGHAGGGRERYTTFRDVVVRNVRDLARKTGDMIRGRPIVQGDDVEEFWALKDVSFEVKQGETLGIIGRNGAGKSTLLKILSRITEPTKGRVQITGRVASLLEVGTGFHPELSGRENIFLNGAILGMRRAEIQSKFDEIVAFAEVENFLDTPVKRYSSGMYVRLAFAVAAHLEPDILVVDEVLAVGDHAFQKKCLGKMQDVSGNGRTVLFVSHNMQAIGALCTRSILLDGGWMISDQSTEKALSIYHDLLRSSRFTANLAIGDQIHRRGSGAVRFTEILMFDVNGNETNTFTMGETVRFRLTYRVFLDVPELQVSVALRGGLSAEVITTVRHTVSMSLLKAGETGSVMIELPDIILRPNRYPLYFWLGNSFFQPFDVVDDLTIPLNVTIDHNVEPTDFNQFSPIGFFSIPSSLRAVDSPS